MQIGDKVEKIEGYKYRGTIVALGTKSDFVEFAVVEVEPSEAVDGLLFIHPLTKLKPYVPPVHAPEPLVPPIPAYPVEIFVPLVVNKSKVMSPNGFAHKARAMAFPYRPQDQLIKEGVKVVVEFHGPVMGDIDNLCKPVLDVLKGSIIRDDSQVGDLHAKFYPNKKPQGFKVIITKYAEAETNT